MNALPCYVPVKPKEPLGLLTPAGQILALDETTGVQLLALVIARNVQTITSALGVIARTAGRASDDA